MQTLVLRIPDDLASDIEEEARRLNSTKSEVARARLAIGRDKSGPKGSGFDLIHDLIGSDVDGPCDLSARKKHYLKSLGFGLEKPRR